MKTTRGKILALLFIVFISISGYVISDLFLFDYFNNKRLEQKKVELVENYYKNEDSFTKFKSLIEGIGNVSNLQFFEPNQISFSIFSKNYDSNNDIAPLVLEIYNDGDSLTMDYQFNKDYSITLNNTDSVETFSKWQFYIDTDQNDKRIIQLLDYIDVSPEKLITIKNELSNLNCKALTRNNQLIKFRYAGHLGESLDYIIPLNQEEIENTIIKIKDKFHYGITNDFIYCGITKW